MKITLLAALLLTVIPAGGAFAAEKEIEKEKEAKPPAIHVENGVVTVPLEIQKKMGLELKEIVPAELARKIPALGAVVDPAPLFLLDAELRDAEAAAAIALTQLNRGKKLFENDQTISLKTLELAENQMRVENTRRDIAANKMLLDWGEKIGNPAWTNRGEFLRRVLKRESVLLRIEVPIDEELALKDPKVQARRIGSKNWIEGVFISSAPTVDLRSQGQAFFVEIAQNLAGLRPGAGVEALLQTDDRVEKGWRIPSGAALRHLGHHWIYLQEAPQEFKRQAIELNSRIEQDWFTKTDLGETNRCVVTGAADLLSAELQAAFGGQGD